MSVNKIAMTLRLHPSIKEFVNEQAEENGLSLSVYIEQVLRKEMKETQYNKESNQK